jgi:hypothetical protein
LSISLTYILVVALGITFCIHSYQSIDVNILPA